MSQRDTFVAAMIAHIGWNYRVGPTRCTGVDHYHDCSGLICYGLVQAGARPTGYCTNSETLAADIHSTGKLLSRDEARATRGALAIRSPNNRIIPGVGHVVCSLGDGTTVEAHSTASGVIRGHFDGNREFSTFGIPPGVAGFDTSPAPVTIGQGVGMGWMIAPHPSGDGSYWTCDQAGHIYTYPANGSGNAQYHGGAGWSAGPGKPVVKPSAAIIAFRPTVSGRGYWMCDQQGHVYSFGDAHYYGGQGWPLHPGGPPVALNGACQDMVPTHSGLGYWLITAPGSIYAFGDATRLGDPYGDPQT